MVEEKEEFEIFEKFDIKLEHGEFGPKIIGEYDELVKTREFLENAIRERLAELSGDK